MLTVVLDTHCGDDGTASRTWAAESSAGVRDTDGRRSGCGVSSLDNRVQSVCPSADEVSDGRPSTRHESTVRVAPGTAWNTLSSVSAGEWTIGAWVDERVRQGDDDVDWQPVSDAVAADADAAQLSDGEFSTTAITSSSVIDCLQSTRRIVSTAAPPPPTSRSSALATVVVWSVAVATRKSTAWWSASGRNLPNGFDARTVSVSTAPACCCCCCCWR